MDPLRRKNKKRLLICVAAGILALVLLLIVLYFRLTYLPGQAQMVKEFNKNEAHFTRTVELLQSTLGARTEINRRTYKEFNSADLKFIFEKLHYRAIFFSSADYIIFYRGSSFGGEESVQIAYLEDGGASFNPQGELVEPIRDNWFFIHRWREGEVKKEEG